MKYLIFFLSAAVVLQANPKNHTVVSGEVNVSQDGNLLEVNVSDRAILNWDAFSIQAGETTRFIQPSQNSAVLNRVTGTEMSEILGLLQAGGQVYLINPNGVVIGKEGRIDTAGFVSSVYEIQNIDFLNGEILSFRGDELGEIINLGTISTGSGPVALIAHRVENSGTISAPDGVVSLNSGHEILLDPTGQGLLFIRPDLKGAGIENNGTIEAYKTQLQADGTPTSLSIGLGGVIDAGSVKEVGGEIYLVAKEGSIEIRSDAKLLAGNEGQIVLHAEKGLLELSGEIEASSGEVRLLGERVYLLGDAHVKLSGETQGGTVLVGGDYRGMNPEIPKADYVYCSPNARVDVDATVSGNGGKAIFWGEKGIAFFGSVNAQGGKESGDGGFVEVSSPGSYSFSGLVSTLAPNGKVGKLLLDPTDITITSAPTAGGSFAGMNPIVFSGPGPSATLDYCCDIIIGNLEDQLALGDVEIDATAGAGGAGDITVDAPLSWSANVLTLNAANNVTFTLNADVTISGTASLSTIVPGSLTFDPGSIIHYSSSASPLSLTATGDIAMQGTLSCTSNADIEMTSTAGNFVATNASITSSGNGNLTFTAEGAGGIPNCALIFSSVSTTGSGNVTMTATGASTPVFFNTGSISATGGGSIILNASGLGQGITFADATLESTTSMTYNGGQFVELLGDVNFITPQPVIVTSPTIVEVGRGTATVTTNASSITFPVGVQGEQLTVIATVGDVFIQGNSSLFFLDVTAAGNIQVSSGVAIDIFLLTLSMTAGGNISLGDNATLQVDSTNSLTLQANSNIQIGNNISVLGNGPVLWIAGQNITASGTTGSIQTVNGDDLNLVTDNLNPNPPNVGTGKFTLPSGYTLCTNSCAGGPGKVFLYSANAGDSTLPSVINTASYTPGSYSGTTYTTGTNEFVGFWYLTQPPPDPPLFEVVFKTAIAHIPSPTPTPPPPVVQTIQIAVTEPVANPPQIAQITEGNLQPPSTPNPKTPCRTPPVAIQAL